MKLFRVFDLSAYAESLGAYLPGGVLFAAKMNNASNIRKLLLGLAGELFRANVLLNTFNNEIYRCYSDTLIMSRQFGTGFRVFNC